MRMGLMLSGIILVLPMAAWAQTAGDINGDGRADQADVTLLSNFLNGSELFSDAQAKRADLNRDRKVDAADAKALDRILNGESPVADEPADNNRTFNASAKKQSFELGLAKVVPEWVRGRWKFTSRIIESSYGGIGQTLDEQITLPGDLSGEYSVYNTSTGEKFNRLCWQVLDYNEDTFSFMERDRNNAGRVVELKLDIINRGVGQSEVRITDRILDVGQTSTVFSNRNGGLLQGIFGMIFGGSMGGDSGVRRGDTSIRTAIMNREPGSETLRIPNTDLSKLRCQ